MTTVRRITVNSLDQQFESLLKPTTLAMNYRSCDLAIVAFSLSLPFPSPWDQLTPAEGRLTVLAIRL